MTVVKALKSGGATILVTAGAPIWVKLASDVGTGGAAAVTSGLFNLGLGYTMGGVLFLTVAPATLGALTMRNISAALSEDPSTVDWSTIGGVAGGVLGTAGIVGLIATYGVGTATGAAITNGLAALGGGSIAAGGWGMLGGLVVAGGIDLGCIAAVGGLTYYFANWNRQSVIKEEFLNKIEEWHGVKKVIPPEIQKYISPKPKL